MRGLQSEAAEDAARLSARSAYLLRVRSQAFAKAWAVAEPTREITRMGHVAAARAEAAWLELLLSGPGMMMANPDCTPGYYNNLGGILGRAGLSRNKSCAVAAAELLGLPRWLPGAEASDALTRAPALAGAAAAA